jgi:Methyltransferase domain
MTNPWLSIPLVDYEGHMSAPAVGQLEALSELFRRAVDTALPRSVAILGISGGNGLDHLADQSVRRIVGIDIHPGYLDEIRRRRGDDARLELHCDDLAGHALHVAPVDLVHAAMIFEHAGLGRALDHAIALIAPGGWLSVVLQLPTNESAVTPTPYQSMQTLKDHFTLIDVPHFRSDLAHRRFTLIDEVRYPLPAGKAFWFGLFRLGAASEELPE